MVILLYIDIKKKKTRRDITIILPLCELRAWRKIIQDKIEVYRDIFFRKIFTI